MQTGLRILLAALLLNCLGPGTTPGQDKKHSAITPAPKDPAWTKRHEAFVAIAKKGDIDVLFLGDALTDAWGGEGHEKDLKGAKVFAKEFGTLKAANFGMNADRTQNLLWRLQNGELDGLKPKVVMLLIGTNNTNGKDNSPEEIAEGIGAVVEEIKKKSPTTKVLLLGIFPRGADPSAATIKAQREKITEVNKLIAKLDDGGKSVKYLDIGGKFLQPDGTISLEIMHNYLHLTEKGYQIWADAVKGPITELLK
jgi:lysophospholipase L1-like esterase